MLPPAEPNPAAVSSHASCSSSLKLFFSPVFILNQVEFPLILQMGDYLALTDKDLKDEAASQNLQAQLPSAQQLQMGSLGSEEIFLPGTMCE